MTVFVLILFILFYFIFITDMKKSIIKLEEKITRLEQGDEKKSTPVLPVFVHQTEVQDQVSLDAKEYTTEQHPVVISHEVSEHSFSQNLGSMFAKIGIAILILGIGFFLNYINNQGLLSYTVKFIAGLVAGGVMIGVGQYLKPKTETYGQILQGGGIVVWLLSVFIGSFIYTLFSLPVALILVALITIVSFIVSMRDGKETTFLIGTLGGYVVPIIAGFYAQDPISTVQLLWYISIVNIGIVIASRYMNWMKTIVIGFVSSWFIFLSLYGQVGDIGWQVQLLFATLIAITYSVVFIYIDIRQYSDVSDLQVSTILAVIHTGIYSVVLYAILQKTSLAPYIGFVIALLAVVHFLMYVYIRYRTQSRTHTGGLTHMVLAIVLLTAAVPLQFDGFVVTMMWFVEGIVISYLATIREFRDGLYMYVVGFLSIILGIYHMSMFGDYTGVREGFTMFINQRYIVWLTAIVLIQGVSYIWKTSASNLDDQSSIKKSILQGSIFLSILVQVCFIGLQVSEIYDASYHSQQSVYAEREKNIRDLESYYGIQTKNLDSSYESFMYRSVQEEYDASVQTAYENSQHALELIDRKTSFAYIIFFGIMTAIYLLIGLFAQISFVRNLGLITLTITLIQLFVLTWSLGPIYRIVSFVAIGLLLLLVSYIYMVYSKKKVSNSSHTYIAGLCLLISFFTYPIYGHSAILQTQDWSHIGNLALPVRTVEQSQVSADTASWYIVPVDSSAWMHSKLPQYGDIRLTHPTQGEIPYVLVTEGATARVVAPDLYTNNKTKIIENTLRSTSNISERVVVIDTGIEGKVYTGMVFQKKSQSKNFRKSVRVYVSDTLLSANSPAWREVEQRNTVFNYTDDLGFVAEKLDITFPNMVSRYIKVEFEDDAVLQEKGVSFANQIQIEQVYMKYEEKESETGIQIKNYISGSFRFDDAFVFGQKTQSITKKEYTVDHIVENVEKKTTEIYIRDARAVTSFTLDISEQKNDFVRDVSIEGSADGIVWQHVAANQIHQVTSPIYTGQSVRIETPPATFSYVRIVIHNNNDMPLRIQSTVYTTQQEIGLLFKADRDTMQNIQILIGNKKVTTPVYDIQKTIAYVGTIVPTYIHMEPIQKNPLFTEESDPFEEKYAYIINSVLVVFVLVLGYLGYTWTKKA